MKFTFPALALVVAAAGVAMTLRAPRNPGEYDVAAFAQLPTLVNGRLKPLDTVARTSLLTMQGRQRVTAPDGRAVSPEEWLLDMLFVPAVADKYQSFEIVHPEVLAMLTLSTAEGAGNKRFSLDQIFKQVAELDRQAKLADATESALRSPFQRAVVQLRNNVALYQRLQNSLSAAATSDFLEQLQKLETNLASSAAAATAARAGQAHSDPAAKAILELAQSFAVMDSYGYLRPIPPAPGEGETGWKTAGAAWTATLASSKPNAVASQYAALGRAWRL
ncbi:MAG: cytochrome C biogenesis protein, partial [Opitutaceae bacterium]|nr:cytochrome C biogenesis protein [Opitutaceae bacterium]